ncbi:hypothetical protein lbkm_3626 [Lachnospiraceae bacterium KM106-2]|nr:hypothetical protein lbkm_3626 [Lachnospiraceae bacterium KM106-2]
MQLKWYVWMFTIFAFLFALYLLELSPWSAHQVAKYNDGYGTFDMKKYNASDVRRVLSKMKPEGFTQSYRYYICDSLFILFYGLFQIVISLAIYHKANGSKLYLLLAILAIAVPVLRGIFDGIENGLLVYTLKSYPDLNTTLITIASLATKCKLLCIQLWMILCGIGILMNLVHR